MHQPTPCQIGVPDVGSILHDLSTELHDVGTVLQNGAIKLYNVANDKCYNSAVGVAALACTGPLGLSKIFLPNLLSAMMAARSGLSQPAVANIDTKGVRLIGAVLFSFCWDTATATL